VKALVAKTALERELRREAGAPRRPLSPTRPLAERAVRQRLPPLPPRPLPLPTGEEGGEVALAVPGQGVAAPRGLRPAPGLPPGAGPLPGSPQAEGGAFGAAGKGEGSAERMVGAEAMEALGRKMLEALKRRLPLHARRVREGGLTTVAIFLVIHFTSRVDSDSAAGVSLERLWL